MIKYILRNLFVIILAFCVGTVRAQTISTFAGSGAFTSSYAGDDGWATYAILAYTWHVAADDHGNVYFTDYSVDRIHRVYPTGIITTVAAPVNGPSGIIVGKNNNLYFCDAHNYRISKINAAGVITTIAGTGVAGFSGDGGPATAAKINRPNGIAMDTAGTIYFADVLNNRVRAIDNSGIITTVAGTGIVGFSGDGGSAVLAQLNTPNDVAVDIAGNIYIADEGNQRVRKVNTSGIITTVAGTGMPGFSGDGGPATAAQLFTPWGLTTDVYGAVYISDHDNNRIRKINSAGIISTIAGNDTAGYGGDGGPATAAKLNAPTGITLDRTGNMYICDWQNFRIRKIKTANTPPVFADSVPHTVKACWASTYVLDTLLRVTDTNVGQTITWNIISGPHHGTASIACSVTDTSAIHIPFGTTYTADSGYNGPDDIKVRTTDGMSDDTTTILFKVGTSAGPITADGSDHFFFCKNETVQLSGFDTGGTWSASNPRVSITASGKMSGVSSGADTITYIVTNACGTDTATLNIWVEICGGVPGVAGANNMLNIFPNPSSGNFMFYLSQPLNEEVQVSVMDVMGRAIRKYNTTSNSTLEIKDISRGVYFVQYITANARGSKIVVVSD